MTAVLVVLVVAVLVVPVAGWGPDLGGAGSHRRHHRDGSGAVVDDGVGDVTETHAGEPACPSSHNHEFRVP